MPIRLLLADDHPIVLDGLEQLFRLEEDFQVLGRCLRGEPVVPELLRLQPDILVLDMRMPKHNGLAVLRELKGKSHSTRVVILAATLTEDEMLEAIRLGVRGVVLKEMAPRLLVECIRKVHGGGQWLEKTIAGQALSTFPPRAATSVIAGPDLILLKPRDLIRYCYEDSSCARELIVKIQCR